MGGMSDNKETELVDEDSLSLENLEKFIPAMNVSIPQEQEEEKDISRLIPDEKLTGLFDDILQTIKTDKQEIDDVMIKFLDFIINSGDTSAATKEAFVQLAKIKNDAVDKVIKIADLMTRIKMKERSTYKPYLTANQTNNISVENNSVKKRELLESIELMKKKGKR